MTCGELIAERQKYPAAKPVRVLLHSVTHIDEAGDMEITLSQEDAMPAKDVTYEGSFVLIRSAP